MSERTAFRVECHADIVRIFLRENLFKGIHKPQHSRRILAFAIDARVLYETVIALYIKA